MSIILLGDGILGSSIKKKYPNRITCHLTRKDLDLTLSLSDMRRVFLAKLPSLDLSPNVLINAAGYTNVGKADVERTLAEEVNVNGIAKLANICRDLDIFFVHISTDFVFKGMRSSRFPYTEFDVPYPMCWYGKTKLLGEKHIKGSQCDFAILRTGWLYNNEKGLIPSIINAIYSNKKIKTIQDQVYSPTHAENLAEQIMAVIDNFACGVFHATSEGKVRPYQLVEYIAEKLGKKSICTDLLNRWNYFEDKVHRPAMCLLENARLKALGINKMKPWEKGVYRCVEVFLEKTKNKE